MIIQRAIKLELKPSKSQRQSLMQSAGTARYAYNWGLARWNALYQYKKKSTDAFKLSKWWNNWKKFNAPWAYDVSKCCAQEAFRDLQAAFTKFFNKGAKHPKFKKKGRCRDSFTLSNDQCHLAGSNLIHLAKIGKVRVKERIRPFIGKINSMTVSRTADRWYISIQYEYESYQTHKEPDNVIGLDLGLSSFAANSDGNKLIAPKPLKKHARKLTKIQRRNSKRPRKTNRGKKRSLVEAKLHAKIANIRKDWLHKETTKLTKTKSVIVMDHLNVKGCMQSRLRGHAKAYSDLGIGMFRQMLDYKSKWYGSEIVFVDKFFASSKLCSDCGWKNKDLSLADRQWTCISCGSVHDRDINAAINFKNWYRDRAALLRGSDRESSSRINALGDHLSRGDCAEGTFARRGSMKREARLSEIFADFVERRTHVNKTCKEKWCQP